MKHIRSFAATSDGRTYTVEYLPYDSKLPAAFEEVKRLVQGAVGDVAVEHVGSTSIPGVGGRNAIDVAVAVEEGEQSAIRSGLYKLGFEDSPFPHYLPLLVGKLAYEDSEYPILLYVVSPESGVYQDWIKFRDYMRNHPADAHAYDAVKLNAVAEGSGEGEHYQEAKAPFLTSMASKINN